MHIFRLLKITIVVAGAVWLLRPSTSAQAFTITPTKYVITVDPGTKSQLTVKVTNTDNSPVTIQPSVTGLAQDSLGRPIFGANIDQAESWVSVGENGRLPLLSPGEATTLTYTIRVPVGAAPGSHYVGLVVNALPLTTTTNAGSSNGTGLSGRLVTLVSIQVAGTAHEELATHLVVRSPVIGSQALSLLIALENQGNIEVPLAGKLRFSDWLGRHQGEAKINLGNELLSGATRQLTYQATLPNPWTSWLQSSPAPTTVADFTPDQPVTSFTHLFRWPGKYTVALDIAFGKTRQTSTRTVDVWYLPWWSIAGGSIFLLLLVSGFYYTRRLLVNYSNKR